MKKQLTDKQKKVIDEVQKGTNMNQAVLIAYSCKDINSAYVISHKLRQNESFMNELRNREEIKNEIIKTEGRKLVDILEELFPKLERAKILIEIARSGDIRSKLQALVEMNKLEGAYPDQKIGLYKMLDNERSAVLTEAGLLKEIKEPHLIEEAEIKEETND